MTMLSEEILTRHCAPTLAGLKTGNIFSCELEDRDALRDDLRELNRTLAGKGLRVIPLHYSDRKVMIYLYRPARLAADLQDRCAIRLLAERGYDLCSGTKAVLHLISRMRQCSAFPHEIGLFLGYPPQDVEGFINQGSRSCKCVGHWKVYHDEKTARKTFARYEKCTRIYQEKIASGSTLCRLAVG